MSKDNERIPNPRELEKEISDFLTKKFGNNIKVSPIVMPQEMPLEDGSGPGQGASGINFDLKPEDLVAYLDQYIIKQDSAKAILATKICTHFNRIRRNRDDPENAFDPVGGVKNNVLMIGPTGVGKTYMIKLIAKKLGVPFVKGDATKFSETGYVGGDVEDLVRDLVREADDDIALAECGIIYLDEIDKIASSRHLVGADISRTGVQRALLKPMEETEVELKVPHDPISMIQEIERFRKSGQRDQRTINTRNILFILSGAFGDMAEIIKKRMSRQGIGFGARITTAEEQQDILKHVRSEDLIEYGFESEFVGRVPVKAVFERLTRDDLFAILQNPNNPIVLGKKLDFDSYGIDIRFDSDLLQHVAKEAFRENTGARGLVSAMERALLQFETRLPSSAVKRFPVTLAVVQTPGEALDRLVTTPDDPAHDQAHERLRDQENAAIVAYLEKNRDTLAVKHNLLLTDSRLRIAAGYYCRSIMDIASVFKKIKPLYDDVKKFELQFFERCDINLVLEEDAIDHVVDQYVHEGVPIDYHYQKLIRDFELGLKLIRDKTGRNRFFIDRKALQDPNVYLDNLVRTELRPQGEIPQK